MYISKREEVCVCVEVFTELEREVCVYPCDHLCDYIYIVTTAANIMSSNYVYCT